MKPNIFIKSLRVSPSDRGAVPSRMETHPHTQHVVKVVHYHVNIVHYHLSVMHRYQTDDPEDEVSGGVLKEEVVTADQGEDGERGEGFEVLLLFVWFVLLVLGIGLGVSWVHLLLLFLSDGGGSSYDEAFFTGWGRVLIIAGRR
jgi:hypothetical protein